jgi:uncharacterized protein (TIGR03066 family)
MRAILSCVLVALVACCTLAADDKIDAKKLVGKWEPKEKPEGSSVVIEFTKSGKVMFMANVNGKETKAEGTYKLDGNKLKTVMKFGDIEQTRTRTISKLTDTELVSSDEKGKEVTLVRVKSK